MRVRIVVVGKDRNDPLVAAADEYVGRVRHHLPIEVVEVKEVALKKGGAPVDRVRRDEADRIRKVLDPDERVIALDERGTALDSRAVAARMDGWMQEGLRAVAFVVGGPSGLDPAFVRQAHQRWALSKMTLPHRMARLILCEQLYRGLSIIRGEPYHK